MTDVARNSADRGLGQPLTGYRQVHTRDRATAEATVAQLLSPHRLSQPRNNVGLDTVVNYTRLGQASAFFITYSSAVRIDRTVDAGYMTVLVPLAGHVVVRHQQREFVAQPLGAHAVLSAGEAMRLKLSEGCSVMGLRAEMSALTEMVRQLAPGAASSTLTFHSAISDRATCRVLAATLEQLTGVLDGYRDASAVPAQLRRLLAEHALCTILLRVPHNLTAELYRPCPAISRRVVREAVDLVYAEQFAELTVADIVEHVGVGMRALELGFRRELDCTPREFIRDVRLERAHRELRAAGGDPLATVTDIALRWGFAHAGRFATAYRAKYGVRPSDTMRRARRQRP